MNSHGRSPAGLYNVTVDRVGFPSRLLKKLPAAAVLARAALAALFAFALGCAAARAESGTDLTIPVDGSPVVHLQMRSGNLTVQTWNQPQIHIASSVAVHAQHFGAGAVQGALRGGDIPIFSTTVQSAAGPVTLPAEDFAVSSLSDGAHDGVNILGGDNGANVTLTVPANTALLWAVIGRGQIEMQDYHAGSFVERVHNGGIHVQNVSGEGFLEVARGMIQASNSSFDRLRARTAAGPIEFSRCNARQIYVSSVNGNISYDDGTFAPGVARFESQNGNVAIGVGGGGVQIGAHSGNGKIFEGFAGGADVRGSGNDAQATVGGGGPVVTASSERGGVFLYNGALGPHPRTGRRFRAVGRPFKGRRL